MLELYPIEHMIELYVENHTMSHQFPEGRDVFTCMFYLDNESIGFVIGT